MSVSDNIARAKTGSYTVTRTASGSYTKGRYSEGATSTLSIDASLQPLNGAETQALPEGQHTENVRKLYTKTELFPRTDSNEPDKLTIDGDTWEVSAVQSWQGWGDAYYKVVVMRVTTP